MLISEGVGLRQAGAITEDYRSWYHDGEDYCLLALARGLGNYWAELRYADREAHFGSCLGDTHRADVIPVESGID